MSDIVSSKLAEIEKTKESKTKGRAQGKYQFMVEIGSTLVLMTNTAWFWIAGKCYGSTGQIWFGNYANLLDT